MSAMGRLMAIWPWMHAVILAFTLWYAWWAAPGM